MIDRAKVIRTLLVVCIAMPAFQYSGEVRSDDLEQIAKQGDRAFKNKQFDEAERLLTVAADQGHSHAQMVLGVMYANGAGVERDPNQAFQLMSQSAASNHSVAQYHLGMMYYLGEGVQKDRQVALEWYRKSLGNGFEPARKAAESLEDRLKQMESN